MKRKSRSTSPLINAAAQLVFLGFAWWFFQQWAPVLHASETDTWLYNASRGLIVIAVGILAFRIVAILSDMRTSPAPDGTSRTGILAAAADPQSPWVKLQSALVLLSVLAVFATIGVGIARIISSST